MIENYFQLFGIPVSLTVDQNDIRTKYRALSRKFHPDLHARSDNETQTEMLERSALLNRAYKTLLDPDETIKYVLRLKGVYEEEEKYTLPPDFLMEVLEINEKLMDAGEDPEVAKEITRQINSLESEIEESARPILEGYLDNKDSVEDLLRIKEYYYKKKYLSRIRKELRKA